MKKIITLVLILSGLVVAPFAYAGKVELTTYYPAPFGEYNGLSANKFKIGTNAQTPATDGVVNFGGLASDPDPSSPGVNHDGDLYYNATDHVFRYFDSSVTGGGAWKAMGGRAGWITVNPGAAQYAGGGIGYSFIYWASDAPYSLYHTASNMCQRAGYVAASGACKGTLFAAGPQIFEGTLESNTWGGNAVGGRLGLTCKWGEPGYYTGTTDMQILCVG